MLANRPVSTIAFPLFQTPTILIEVNIYVTSIFLSNLILLPWSETDTLTCHYNPIPLFREITMSEKRTTKQASMITPKKVKFINARQILKHLLNPCKPNIYTFFTLLPLDYVKDISRFSCWYSMIPSVSIILFSGGMNGCLENWSQNVVSQMPFQYTLQYSSVHLL